MTRYLITRARGTVMSICEACGDMSPAERIDRRVFEWQRKHTAAHRAAEGRHVAPPPTPGHFQWKSCGDNRLGQPTGRWVGPIEVSEP